MRGGVRWRERPLSWRSGGLGRVSRVMLCIGNAHCPPGHRMDTFTFRPSECVACVRACVPTRFPPFPPSLPRECVPNPGGTPRAARSKLTPQQISACQFSPTSFTDRVCNNCTHRQRKRISVRHILPPLSSSSDPLTPCRVFCNQDGQLVSSSCLSISLKSRPTNWILSRQWEKETRSRTCDQYQRG